MKKIIAATALCLALPAQAGEYLAVPVAGDLDEVTYERGTPVVTRKTATAFIAIMAVEDYFGRPSLIVTVTNEGDAAFNFGTENITASVQGEKQPTVVYNREQLEDHAENRAMWAGIAAGLAASSAGTSSFSSTTYTPYGSVQSYGTFHDNYASQAAAARYGAAINAGLNERLEDARQNALQTTTVRPGESYGGRIVLPKPKAKLPAPLNLTVLGETFAFEMRK